MIGQAVRLADAVVLTGRLITAAAYAVRVTRDSRASAGYPPSADLELLATVLAPRPHGDACREAASDTELMTTNAVAELLGISSRQVRRLARRLDARTIGGRLLYPRPAVIEHLEGRGPHDPSTPPE